MTQHRSNRHFLTLVELRFRCGIMANVPCKMILKLFRVRRACFKSSLHAALFPLLARKPRFRPQCVLVYIREREVKPPFAGVR
jgi:hypothetical protein